MAGTYGGSRRHVRRCTIINKASKPLYMAMAQALFGVDQLGRRWTCLYISISEFVGVKNMQAFE